jgi:hypothetical protein
LIFSNREQLETLASLIPVNVRQVVAAAKRLEIHRTNGVRVSVPISCVETVLPYGS